MGSCTTPHVCICMTCNRDILTQVKVCCSPVGEEECVQFLVSTFLLQTCGVGQYGLLVVLLLEKRIPLIFQALHLLWGRIWGYEPTR